MATRSLIGKQNADGTITNIYCHWDGYPEHNGVILQEHYSSPTKVDQLLALGNLSYLSDEIGEQQDFNDIKSHKDNWCLAYGRDRGEKNQEAGTVTRKEFFDNTGIDYLYIYNNEFEWECYDAYYNTPVKILAETA
jgi:hypothetical protein